MIVEDRLDGKSVANIATEYGMSERWVYNILKEKGVSVSRAKRQHLAPNAASTPVSPLHKLIGQRLYEHYFVECSLTRAEASESLSMAPSVLKRTERGTRELTLTDLQKIAGFMKIDLKELVHEHD